MSNDSATSELDLNPRYQLLRGFRSPFLPGVRDISIYLPEAYLTEPLRRFPVFYLHDGQNLFDGRTAYIASRTWQAHTTADALTAAGLIDPVILIGVANTGVRRMAEYTPTRDPKLGGGRGPQYARLLIQNLKPLIDSTYRTLPGPTNTGLGGSSLGGLISLAIGLEHPDVFTRIAVLSPSVWWNNRSILSLVDAADPKPPLRLWLDIGTAEGRQHVIDTDLLHEHLLHQGWRDDRDLHYDKIPDAVHAEDAWAARFGDVLQFLFPASR